MAPVIAIWRLSPDLLAAVAGLPAEHLSSSLNQLSAEERQRVAAFHADEERRLYIASHLALRLVLSRLLGQPPASFKISQEGKPRLITPSSDNPGLRFNLAHTRRAAVIATTTGCEIGIDIEQHRPIQDLESLAARIMSPTESAEWHSLAPNARFPAFYRLWTRKEAYLKAIGLGLYRELEAVTVPIVPTHLNQPAIVTDRDAPQPSPDWHLCDLPAWENYSSTLCWQASVPQPGVPAYLLAPHLTIQDLSIDDLFPNPAQPNPLPQK